MTDYKNMTPEEEAALVPDWVQYSRDKQWQTTGRGDFVEIGYGGGKERVDTIDVYDFSRTEVPIIVKALEFWAANGRLPSRDRLEGGQ